MKAIDWEDLLYLKIPGIDDEDYTTVKLSRLKPEIVKALASGFCRVNENGLLVPAQGRKTVIIGFTIITFPGTPISNFYMAKKEPPLNPHG